MNGTDGRHPDLKVTQRAATVSVVEVGFELDMLTSPALECALAQRLVAGDRLLVVDLSGCEFMGSFGLAVLTRIDDAARRGGAELVLTGLSRRLTRVVEVTGLDGIITIFGSTEEAIAARAM